MAIIGLSKPYYAKYNYDELTGSVTYSDGGLMGKLVEMNNEPETTEDSNLYADNGIAESERAFSGGNVSFTTDHFTQEVTKTILGVKEQAVTIEGADDATELVFDDEANAPYLGVGYIIKGKKNGEHVWRGVVLLKVMFSIPSEAATTQGESIEWQTPELSATIMKSDEGAHAWRRQADFATEALADAYVRKILNITTTDATV